MLENMNKYILYMHEIFKRIVYCITGHTAPQVVETQTHSHLNFLFTGKNKFSSFAPFDCVLRGIRMLSQDSINILPDTPAFSSTCSVVTVFVS